jgi:NADH dehydrogenase
VLVEGTDKVLAAFPEPLQQRARRDLEHLGVDVRLHTLVTGVDATGVDVKQNEQDARIEAATKIWAAGVQASSLGKTLAEQSGISVDRAGRVPVQPDATLPGHAEVFVIGDLMALNKLPGVAEVAMQSGIHASRTITRRLRGTTDARPFKYRDLGTMATIARFRAVVFIGRVRVSGPIAWLMWLVVHLAFLTGFKNRLAAVANWAVAFLGRDRRQRTITEQQVFARTHASPETEGVTSRT